MFIVYHAQLMEIFATNSRCANSSLFIWGILACHIPTVYNGHRRGPMTLIPIAERLAVNLLLSLLTTSMEDRAFYVSRTCAQSLCFRTTKNVQIKSTVGWYIHVQVRHQ